MNGFSAAALGVTTFVVLTSSASAQERHGAGIGITVWSDADFRGESATFRTSVPDLHAYRLDGKISSMRVAAGENWEACEQPNFGGRCRIYSGEESNLRGTSWNDKIRSLRRVNYSEGGVAAPQPATPARVVLYSRPGFQGQRVAIVRSTADLRSAGFSKRARSARVSGTWQFCREPQFAACEYVSGDQANLADLGLAGKLSSVRRNESTNARPPRLVLYGGLDMNGLSRDYNGPISDTSVPRARSASVQGTWYVCARTNFRPPCKELSRDAPDLLAGGLTTILSARPK